MSAPPQAIVPASEVHLLRSSATGGTYQVSVALPFHHDPQSGKRWPVIYVLDGNLYFGLVVDMVRAMNIRVSFCDELPDAFVVGVGYPVEGSLLDQLHQVMHLRMRDFLPARDEAAEEFIQRSFPVASPAQAGEAPNFLQFLEQDLVPMVDATYPTDPGDRTVLGHSWGGDFVLDTLFRRPRLFSRWVAASGTPDLDAEAAYAASHDDLPVRLHLVTESTEPNGVADQKSLVERLTARAYPGLRFTHDVLDQTHCAIVPPAFQGGLVRVFG